MPAKSKTKKASAHDIKTEKKLFQMISVLALLLAVTVIAYVYTVA